MIACSAWVRAVPSLPAALVVAGACAGDVPPTTASRGRNDRLADHEHRAERRRRPRSTSPGSSRRATNWHEFEPAPRDARSMAEADVVFINGLHLEEPTRELAEANVREGVQIVRSATHDHAATSRSSTSRSRRRRATRTLTSGRTRRYALALRRDRPRQLIAPRPRRARTSTRPTTTAFAARIDALDEAVRKATATVPAATESCSPTTTRSRTSPASTAGRSSARSSRPTSPSRGRGTSRPDRPGRRRGRAGDLRLGGLPEPGARADRAGRPARATSTSCATTTCPGSRATRRTRGSR